jgi:hypothetical protein
MPEFQFEILLLPRTQKLKQQTAAVEKRTGQKHPHEH